MTANRIPVQILTGFLGAGKTTLINALLQNKPAPARVAVIINEFSRSGIDASLLDAPPPKTDIQQIAGGCICCTTAPLFRTSLIRLLRQQKPDYLLIEPSGLGSPASLTRLLDEPGFQTHLFRLPTRCLITPPTLTDDRYWLHETFQAQLAVADEWIFTQATPTAAELERLPDKKPFIIAPDLASLDQLAKQWWQQAQHAKQQDTGAASTEEAPFPPLQLSIPSTTVPLGWQQTIGEGVKTLSYRLPPPLPNTNNPLDLLEALCKNTKGLLRAKGWIYPPPVSLAWQFTLGQFRQQPLNIADGNDCHGVFFFALDTTNDEIAQFQIDANQLLNT